MLGLNGYTIWALYDIQSVLDAINWDAPKYDRVYVCTDLAYTRNHVQIFIEGRTQDERIDLFWNHILPEMFGNLEFVDTAGNWESDLSWRKMRGDDVSRACVLGCYDAYRIRPEYAHDWFGDAEPRPVSMWEIIMKSQDLDIDTRLLLRQTDEQLRDDADID